jgi:hypothetical protein
VYITKTNQMLMGANSISYELYKRVPISAVATVAFKDDDRVHSVEAMVGSISFGGIGLYSDDPITGGTDISIAINFISTAGAMEKAVIERHVVYNSMIGHLCYTGIQFAEEINKTNQPSLCEHIECHLQHHP